MGADMVLSACALPIDVEGQLLDRRVVNAVIRGRIAALGDEVLLEVSEWFLEDDVAPDEEGWQALGRARLRDCLNVLDEDRRDTAELCLAGRWWLFAGGMSWGDAPSDAYEQVVGLSIAGITEEPVNAIERAAAVERVRVEGA